MKLAGSSSASAIATGVRDGDLSATTLCAEACARAEEAHGTFWSLDASAPEAAAEIDRRVAGGEPVGPLAGVPVAIKDNFDVAGLPSSLGVREGLYQAERDADAVRRLREAGAVVIGKTAMDQLAWTMDGSSPAFPPLENPRRPGRLTGGSSGGSAAAVAAGIVPLALGSDTAGSVRLPAAWCEVVGFKVGPGVVSLDGCAPLASTFDSAGVFARSVADCALAFAALLAGSPSAEPAGAIVARSWGEPDEEGLRSGWERALAALVGSGWDITPLEHPIAAPGFGRAVAAEFAAAWSERLAAETVESDVRLGIDRGVEVDTGRLAETRAELVELGGSLESALPPGGVLVTPTAPVGPAPSGEVVDVGLVSRFTLPLSAFGWPAISVPVPPRLGGGAIQIAAAPGGEATVLGCAAAAEAALGVAGDAV